MRAATWPSRADVLRCTAENSLNKQQRVPSVSLKVESVLMEDKIGVMNKPFWWMLDFVVTAAFVAKCWQQQQLWVVCQNLIVIEFSGGGEKGFLLIMPICHTQKWGKNLRLLLLHCGCHFFHRKVGTETTRALSRVATDWIDVFSVQLRAQRARFKKKAS